MTNRLRQGDILKMPQPPFTRPAGTPTHNSGRPTSQWTASPWACFDKTDREKGLVGWLFSVSKSQEFLPG